MRYARLLRRSAAVALSALLLAAAALGVERIRRHFVLQRLESAAAFFGRDFTPLRFTVLSRSDQFISARFLLYDADGRELSMLERSWNGSELSIEAVVVESAGLFFVFPSRAAADGGSPRSGTELFWYYDRDSFPAVYESNFLDPGVRAALAILFSRAKAFGRRDEEKRGIRLATLRPRELEVGALYSLIARRSGGLDVVRD